MKQIEIKISTDEINYEEAVMYMESRVDGIINNKSKEFKIKTNVIAELIEDTKIGVYRKSIYLPVGVYAVSFYIDSNNNQKLDFNFFGIPTEQYGFSNNSMGFFGPPSFDQASFTIDKESKISIKAR